MLWKSTLKIPANLENSAVVTGLEKVSFHSNPTEKQCQRFTLISHTSKVMLKILQARLQQYMNHELPDVQAGFRKSRGNRDQIAKIHWIIRKETEFQKNIYFCFIDWTKAFDRVDHSKMWKILNEMGLPHLLTCWDLYAGQKAIVSTGHGTGLVPNREMSMSRLYIVTLLFNLYAEYIMRNARLDEAQAGIKIARRNINNSDRKMIPPLWQKEKN